METFSASLAFVRGIQRSPVNSPHKGQWRGALMFSLICAWINGWVNNREAGDLRRHHAHYDVTVMQFQNSDESLFAAETTPLILAAQRNRYEVVSVLLQKGQTIAVSRVDLDIEAWKNLPIFSRRYFTTHFLELNLSVSQLLLIGATVWIQRVWFQSYRRQHGFVRQNVVCMRFSVPDLNARDNSGIRAPIQNKYVILPL